MARNRRERSRKGGGVEELAVKLAVLGGGLAIAPLFFGSPSINKALVSLAGMGWLMLAGGVLVLWLRRKSPDMHTPTEVEASKMRLSIRAGRDVAPIVMPTDTPEAEAFARTQRESPAVTGFRPQTWSPEVFDIIEWRRFEAVVEALFAQSGFITKSQPHGADEGIDVWLYPRTQPDKPCSLLQCKHWSDKPVGVDKVRELRGVMAAKNVSGGKFATSGSFTSAAKTFAAREGIDLIDMGDLLKLIGRSSPEQQRDLLRVALEGDYWRPTCVNCGIKMTERVPRGSGAKFWGCVNYPQCKTTMAIRRAR